MKKKKKKKRKGVKSENKRAQIKKWFKLARIVKIYIKKERAVCVMKLLGCGENPLCVIQWKSRVILNYPIQ
jgi:hypothetical protein